MSNWLKTAFDKAFKQFAREAGETESCEALPQNVSQWFEESWLGYCAPLVERWEGMARMIPGGKVVAYPDPATGGKPYTIGIGSTRDELGQPIKPDAVWTVERARKHFMNELAEFGAQVDKLLGDAPTGVKQKAAIVSWTYNVGEGNAKKSTLLKKHKAGDFEGAAKEFGKWVYANGKKMKGLERRRRAEADLYSS